MLTEKLPVGVQHTARIRKTCSNENIIDLALLSLTTMTVKPVAIKPMTPEQALVISSSMLLAAVETRDVRTRLVLWSGSDRRVGLGVPFAASSE